MGTPPDSSTVSQVIDVEVTPPTAAASLSRRPDHHGWYTRPVTVTFSVTAISGIRSCTAPIVYSVADSTSASVNGTCTDNAGQVAGAAVSFKYDGSPPAPRLSASPGDGAVGLRWSTNDVAPISRVRITRSPGLHDARPSIIYTGSSTAITDHRAQDGRRYRYTVELTDQAGNKTLDTIVVTPGPRLQSPRPGQHLSAPPRLAWTTVRGAAYYNVQLFRVGSGKILSLWPTRPTLQLPAHWRFGGHRYRLRPGRYRWYVWPGFGSPAQARYGSLIGSRSFIVE